MNWSKKKIAKYPVKKVGRSEAEKYEQSAYFKEKDKQAIEFLKKHPVPEKLLK